MKGLVAAITACAVVAGLSAIRSSAAVATPPPWAYPLSVSNAPADADVNLPRASGNVVDACSSCHLPNGFGRPESASLAGLPARYIEEQIADYRRGVRKSAESRMRQSAAMAALAAAASDSDIQQASAHFASLQYRPWIRVVERDVVPKVAVVGGMFMPIEAGGNEAIGSRIVEVPADPERTSRNDSASGFVAYVPVSSIKRGAMLVTTGAGGRTVRCALCHGDDLRGLGPVPGVAGRSPTYQVRQLFDMQHGFRHGLGSDLMRATVARLSEADMIAIAAYTASRQP